MAPSAQNLVKLVQSGNYGRVEDAWMQAASEPDGDLAALTPVLGALVKAGQGESAEVLAFSTFNEIRERLDASDRLELIKAMSIAIPASEELRSELVNQMRSFHADHPNLESLLSSSGLANGSKTPRLALRTLDLCLMAAPGSFLLSRRDDTVAQIEQVADDSSTYTVSFNQQRREYEAAELAVEFGPVDVDDFRVLSQHRPERVSELLDKDPTTLIVSLLRSQTERFTVDDLRFVLCPRFLSPDKWTKWWTRARAQVKKTHLVRLEGRNPATLIYDATEWTIEDMLWEKFPKSEDATEYFDAVESYFREAKSRGLKTKPEYLNKMAVALCDRIKGVGRHAADRGLGAVLILERLLQGGAALDAEPPTSAVEMIRTADDPRSLLASLTDDRLWTPALAAAREAHAEEWPEIFSAQLPSASMAACEPIAAELHAAGRSDLLAGCVERIMNEPDDCIEAIAWMWKGSDSLKGVTLPSRLEMLVRILSTVAKLDRSGIERRDRAKTVRTAVKNALGSATCAGFRECLDGMEESMASTIRRQVGRLDGLGPALRDQMTEEIRKRFPALWVKAKIDPWKNDSVIFTTEAGLRKLQGDVDQLVNVEMPANAKAIGEAAAHGDLSENSEYKFALEARDMLRARLAAMQNQLVLARTIEPLEITTRCVGIGTRVTLRRGNDGGTRTMTFLGPWDAAIENGIFNYQAPLSQQLMGRNAGDSLTIALDDGQEAEWTVEHIEAGL